VINIIDKEEAADVKYLVENIKRIEFRYQFSAKEMSEMPYPVVIKFLIKGDN
jgi:hypothetical protein